MEEELKLPKRFESWSEFYVCIEYLLPVDNIYLITHETLNAKDICDSPFPSKEPVKKIFRTKDIKNKAFEELITNFKNLNTICE